MWKFATISHPTIILKSTHDKLATERVVARQRTHLDQLHCLMNYDHGDWFGFLFLEFVQELLKAAMLDQPDGMSILIETLGTHLVLPGK